MLRHALVLTAGLGTRLQPLTSVRAKPAIPVAGEPLIRRIITWLAGQGVTELVLNLHHLPHTLTAVVGDGSDLGARVRYSWEQPVVLGSAGGPRRALPIIGGSRRVLPDQRRYDDRPRSAGARIGARRLGGAGHDGAGPQSRTAQVRRRPDAPPTALSRASRRVARPPKARHISSAFKSHAPKRSARSQDGSRSSSIARCLHPPVDVAPRLAFEPMRATRRSRTSAPSSDYWATSFACLGNRPPEQAYGRRVRIDAGARITRSILWDDVEVGADSVVEDCIVTDQVRIPAGSAHRRSVLRRSDQGLLVTPL